MNFQEVGSSNQVRWFDRVRSCIFGVGVGYILCELAIVAGL